MVTLLGQPVRLSHLTFSETRGHVSVSVSLAAADAPPVTILGQYEHAIKSVGSVLEFYDEDRRFPVMGFGGCPGPWRPAQHSFAVSGNDQNPEVEGIEGVLSVYRYSRQGGFEVGR